MEIGTAIFQPGDHLRVRRSWGYFHHGIYTDSETVVQFGGRIVDKGYARIEEAPFAELERNGKVEKIDHAQLKWPGAGWNLPDEFSPDKIVARARCLTKLTLNGTYNLFGSNCETVAFWCTCGFAESLQRQVLNKWKTFAGMVILSVVSFRVDRKLLNLQLTVATYVLAILSVAESIAYLWNNRRFYLSVEECKNP